MGGRGDPVSDALDGATGDYGVSGDAMRWSPELAEAPVDPSSALLPGLDAAVGLGSVLGLDAGGMRRLVTGALFSLTSAAGEVVGELRQLTRGTSAGVDDAVPTDEPVRVDEVPSVDEAVRVDEAVSTDGAVPADG